MAKTKKSNLVAHVHRTILFILLGHGTRGFVRPVQDAPDQRKFRCGRIRRSCSYTAEWCGHCRTLLERWCLGQLKRLPRVTFKLWKKPMLQQKSLNTVYKRSLVSIVDASGKSLIIRRCRDVYEGVVLQNVGVVKAAV
jgi:hypothetical protein